MTEPTKKNARVADAYEAAYMGADEEVSHREKISYPRWFRLMMPFVLATILTTASVGSALAGEPLGALLAGLMLPVALLGWIVMSTLRVTVTSKKLHVQYGLWGPSIPLESIEHCEAEHYSVWKYGGYGIRYSITEKAWCYNMLGDKGQAVRIHWRDENGKLKKTLVASENHVALASAIERARAESALAAPATAVEETTVYSEEQATDMSALAAEGGDEAEELTLEEELAAVEEALAEVVEA